MQPETLCGTDIEAIRKTAAQSMQEAAPAIAPQLKRLLLLGFDCILTTNYTYEPETVLLGEAFSEKQRKKAVRTFGESRRQINLQLCYEVPHQGKNVPIWHIHGDAMRQNSLVLSYHSYIKVMASLWEYSQSMKDHFAEHQASGTPLPVGSWLEWFLAGDVYSVGFGWDFAELDLWWAMERNAREHGQTGQKQIFLFSRDKSCAAKEALLSRYGAQVQVQPTEKFAAEDFDQIIGQIEAMLLAAEAD